MSLEIGQKLGPYEIVEQAGAGGMGEVYKAKDTRLDRTVAVKILPANIAGSAEFKERFERSKLGRRVQGTLIGDSGPVGANSALCCGLQLSRASANAAPSGIWSGGRPEAASRRPLKLKKEVRAVISQISRSVQPASRSLPMSS